MLHKIEARLAHRVVEDLRRQGAHVDDLLKEVGLRRADVADPEARIPYAAVLQLVERAATVLGDPSLGLRLGASYEARGSGLFGFVMLNSSTLMEALQNLQRCFQVVGDGEDVEIERTGPHLVLRFRETDPALRGLRHNSEYMAAIIARACRDMTRKRISPVRVEFMHARPNSSVAYDRYLGCRVRFQVEWDALVYDAKVAGLPVVGADNLLLKVLKRACRQTIGSPTRKKDLVLQVRELAVEGLTKGRGLMHASKRGLFPGLLRDAVVLRPNSGAVAVARSLSDRHGRKVLELSDCLPVGNRTAGGDGDQMSA